MFPWIKKLLLYFSLPALLFVSLASFGTYVHLRQSAIPPVLGQLEKVADIKAAQLSSWFTALNSSLIKDLNDPSLVANATTVLTTPIKIKPEYKKAYKDLKTYFQQSNGTRLNTSILSNGGIILFSTDPTREGQYQPLQNTTTYFSLEDINSIKPNFYESSMTNQPMITFAISLVNKEGRRLGAIAVDLNLADLDRKIRDFNPVKSPDSSQTRPRTLKSYLVGRLSLVENSFIAKQSEPTDSLSLNAKESSQLFKSLNSTGISQALQGKTGTGLYLNYNKIPVIGDYRWIPQYRLGLLVEVPQSEIFAVARSSAGKLLIAGISLILVVDVARKLIP